MPAPETTPRFKASLNGLAPAFDWRVAPAPDVVPVAGGGMLDAVFAKLPGSTVRPAAVPTAPEEAWVPASAFDPTIEALVGDILANRVCLPVAVKPPAKLSSAGAAGKRESFSGFPMVLVSCSDALFWGGLGFLIAADGEATCSVAMGSIVACL